MFSSLKQEFKVVNRKSSSFERNDIKSRILVGRKLRKKNCEERRGKRKKKRKEKKEEEREKRRGKRRKKRKEKNWEEKTLHVHLRRFNSRRCQVVVIETIEEND